MTPPDRGGTSNQAVSFSVVSPCHNAAASVAAALFSVAEQTYAPLEIIVVNDRSTDDSKKEIQSTGIEMQLIDADEGNAGAARNIGINRAKGDYIAFLDADDLWYPDHLERAASLLAGGRDVAYMNRYEFIYRHEKTARLFHHPWPDARSQTGLSAQQFLEAFRSSWWFGGMSHCIMKRSRLMEVGGFDGAMTSVEDFELWLRMLEGHTWAYEANVTSRYHPDVPGNLSSRKVVNAYNHLYAAIKNRARHPYAEMTAVIQQLARRAMSLAYLQGDRTDQQRAWQLAGGHLTKTHAVIFGMVSICPVFYRVVRAFRKKN